MNVLDKFGIVPLNQRPTSNIPENKADSILPIILLGVGIFIVGVFFHEEYKKNLEKEKNLDFELSQKNN